MRPPPDPRSRAALLGAVSVAVSVAVLLAGGSGCDRAPDGAGRPGAAKRTAPGSPSPAWKRPRTVAAVGDSITRGFDACAVLADCVQVSWVTGTDKRVASLASRLRRPDVTDDQRGAASSPARAPAAARATVRDSWNLARSGALMAELPGQLDTAVPKQPDLVAVLIGANDACRRSVHAMTPVAAFRRSFDRALDRADRRLPHAQVFVASVPDLERLWRVGRQHPFAKQVWRLGICPSMLNHPDSMAPADQARRARVSERVDRYNQVLNETCARHPHCRYDGGAVHDYPFSINELSPWDWFHPSVRGQAELARILYRAAFGG